MALRMAINYIGAFFGLLDTSSDTTSAEEAADAVSGIGDAAGSAADKLKDLAAPFDELNVLQEQTASGGGGGGTTFEDVLDPALQEALDSVELSLENIRMKANDARDSILRFFGFIVEDGKIIEWDPALFENNLINKFPEWTKTIQAAFDNWADIIGGLKRVFSELVGVISRAVKRIKKFISLFINDDTVSSFINTLGGALNRLADWVSKNGDTLTSIAAGIYGVYTALKLFGTLGTTGTILAAPAAALV